MRAACLVVASVLVGGPAAGSQELRGFLVLDGRPGYLTNVYLDPSFATWDPSVEGGFGTGGASGILEWTGERVSVRANAGMRALGRVDSARAWWSALFGAGLEWRAADRLRIGVDGSYAESERPDRRRTLWGRAGLRWDASSRVRLSLGPALARTRLSSLELSGGPPIPGLPIPGGSGAASEATADAVMLSAAVDAWPGGRWQVAAEVFAVRTEAEDLGLDYAGGGGTVRLTRWFRGGASLSAGLGGEGFGYRAALDEADGTGEIPEDDVIWRAELDGRWPLGRRLDFVTRMAALRRSTSEAGNDLDFYGSVGLRLTLGGVLSPAGRGVELWTPAAAGMRMRIPYEGEGRLYLTGDFNAWAEPGIPLGREDDAVHTAMVELDPGTYRYRVRVVEGTTARWLELPPGTVTEDDGYGGRNGLLVVTGEGR